MNGNAAICMVPHKEILSFVCFFNCLENKTKIKKKSELAGYESCKIRILR